MKLVCVCQLLQTKPSRGFAQAGMFLLQGVRVEVNGQVLSQGGNLGADRITDTTSTVQACH